LAVGKNAVVVATDTDVMAFDLADGKPRWTQPLPAPPLPWGVALNRDGRVVVSLENGDVVCFN
jgi:outer membrane protein assembly factor BamB